MISIDIDPHVEILTLNIDAPLASANMRTLSDRADAAVSRAGGLRGMLIKAAPFPSWRELAALFDKLRCLQEYRHALARVAVVTESSPMEFAAQLAAYFPGAEIDRFSAQRMERADAWVQGGAMGEGDAVVLTDSNSATGDDIALHAEPERAPEAVVELDGSQDESGEEDAWFV